MDERPNGELAGLLMAGGWLALVLAAEIITGRNPSVVLASLYALSPLIACAALSVRATAGFGAAAFALAVVSGVYTGTDDTAQQVVRLINLALISLAAVAIAAIRVHREDRFARVSSIAEVAQRTILPTLPARIGPVGVGARYVSAVEDTLVGGDLYDYVRTPEHTSFIVGDVRGKGVAAVEQAARVIRAFRQAAAASTDLPTIAGAVSTYLLPFLDEEEFVTAVIVQVHLDHLTVVSCGHPPPLLVRPDGTARHVVAPAGLPLGLSDDYQAVDVPWAAAERLLLYTDGLSEARDESGEFLRLETLGPVLASGPIEPSLDGLLASILEHADVGRARDDLAVLLLENAGTPTVADTAERHLLVTRPG